LMVSPVLDETKDRLKNVVKEEGADELVISSDTVKTILKDIPNDRQFSGLLEHCNIEKLGPDCRIRLTDGKRKRSFTGKCYPRSYLPFRKIVGPALASSERESGKRIVINLKRFIQLLSTIDKICPDTTGESPVWIDFTESGQIVLRGVNNINGQRCIGIMSAYQGIEGRWLEPDAWETSMMERPKNLLRKTKKLTNIKYKRKHKRRSK